MAKTKADVKKHVHKLKRIRFKSSNTLFMCVLDCQYKINPALALGKKSICWRCGNDFNLDEYAIRLAKPHCPACHKPKNKPDIVTADGTAIQPQTTPTEAHSTFDYASPFEPSKSSIDSIDKHALEDPVAILAKRLGEFSMGETTEDEEDEFEEEDI